MENSDKKILSNKTAYQATASSLESIKEAFPECLDILNCFNEGNKTVELRKRYMLKQIDEVWVRAIEDTLPSMDVIIRNPSVALQEKEEILPVELTRKITGRSVEYLCQHTDMINEIRPDGTVVPSKLLNVFQDDTLLTYENKFINTLLNRVYGFVSMRYDSAEESGEDEKNTKLTFNQEFEKEGRKGKVTLSIEISEPPKENEEVKNYFYTSDLWKRVKAIKKAIDGYMGTRFVVSMGKNYVRPPIMRTNKLLKNVEFRQCLSLWEFLESYENTGYETLISESLENVSEDCIRDFYNSIVAQYILFKEHIANDFVKESTLDERPVQTIKPHVKDELDEFNESEYDVINVIKKPKVNEVEATGEEDKIDEAILLAIEADKVLLEKEIKEEDKFNFMYRYSYTSRLILAEKSLKDFYNTIKNEVLSYGKVKSKISWEHEIFSMGRKKCMRIGVKGKSLCVYFPVEYKDEFKKYHVKDVSNVKKNKDFPLLLKIKSKRAITYACELIAYVMGILGIEKREDYKQQNFYLKKVPLSKLIKNQLVKFADGQVHNVVDERVERANVEYRYRYSFVSRLILSGEKTMNHYNDIKNAILSYKKVSDRTSWEHETFTKSRENLVTLKVRGKTLNMYLPLDANVVDKKYHLSVAKSKKENMAILKIKSDRSVKYGIELLDMIMNQKGIAKGKIDNKDYRYQTLTIEELISKGLIKNL